MTLPNGGWLPNAERRPIDGREGSSWADVGEPKLVAHTTEGTSIPGAEAAYARYPPHLIWKYSAPTVRTTVQHISLERAAYALKNSAAEKDGAVQVEIVGFARDTSSWTDDKLRAFAEDIAAPVYRMRPYLLQAPQFAGGDAYGLNGSVRMTWEEWDGYSGLVGHQHSPGDTHWDPGELNAARILEHVRTILGGTLTTADEQVLAMLTRDLGPDAAETQNLGHSIQRTNGLVVDWIVPTLGRLEALAGSTSTEVAGISAVVTRLEAKIDALAAQIEALSAVPPSGGTTPAPDLSDVIGAIAEGLDVVAATDDP